jgi:mRNA-degrading endonuclease RelE of RelBE toxin-antitoxin system
LRNLEFSQRFQKQLRQLSAHDQKRALETLKEFRRALQAGPMPEGLGFKKIGEDKYEIRVDLRIRIAMKRDGDALVLHVIGSHENIRDYLKNYR